MTPANLVREFFDYLGKNKKLWLIPIAIIVLLVGMAALFSLSQGIASFFYAQP